MPKQWIQSWPGVVALFHHGMEWSVNTLQTYKFQVWSDASGTWGRAAIYNQQWLQISWSDYPEFQVWGNQWLRSTVWFHCDNQAVVDVIWGGYCKDKYLAHMLRSMFFLEAQFAFTATARHIPGIENTQADALSCNNHPEFAALVPQACRTPSKMP